jgi:WhiB family redox-sensing transcriptional regulator
VMTTPSLGAWVKRAACHGSATDLFLPEADDTKTVHLAKAVCARCPVVEQCRAYGLAHPCEVGIWGGLTERERSRERRRSGRGRAA